MREPEPQRGFRWPSWSVTTWLIIANTVVFAFELLSGFLSPAGFLAVHGWGKVFNYLPLMPYEVIHRGWIWQLLTFQFLHAGLMHIGLNCLVLYIFGHPVETAMGRSRFLRLYLASGAFGGVIQVVLAVLFPGHFPPKVSTLGASAGVFGVLAAFAWMNWETPITALIAFVLPVTFRAKYLLIVEAVISALGLLDPSSHIAHGAHLGGMAFGLAYTMWWLRQPVQPAWWHRLGRRPRGRVAVVAGSRQRTYSPPPPRPTEEDLPPAEFIRREVDPILDKISAHGIQSLTDRERKILQRARDRMGQE